MIAELKHEIIYFGKHLWKEALNLGKKVTDENQFTNKETDFPAQSSHKYRTNFRIKSVSPAAPNRAEQTINQLFSSNISKSVHSQTVFLVNPRSVKSAINILWKWKRIKMYTKRAIKRWIVATTPFHTDLDMVPIHLTSYISHNYPCKLVPSSSGGKNKILFYSSRPFTVQSNNHLELSNLLRHRIHWKTGGHNSRARRNNISLRFKATRKRRKLPKPDWTCFTRTINVANRIDMCRDCKLLPNNNNLSLTNTLDSSQTVNHLGVSDTI